MKKKLPTVRAVCFSLVITNPLCFSGCSHPPLYSETRSVQPAHRFGEQEHQIECAVLQSILEQKGREIQKPVRLALLTSQPASKEMSNLVGLRFGPNLEVKAVRSLASLPNHRFVERGVEFEGYLGVVEIAMKGSKLAVVAVSDGDGQATVTANRGAKGWVTTFDGFVYP